MELTNKTRVLITGASSGLGRALAMKLANFGVQIALTARNKYELEKTAGIVTRAGGDALVIPADLRVKVQAVDAVRSAIRKFGGLDVLVNCAGKGNLASVEDTPDEHIEEIFELNVYPLWYTVREALPLMKEQDRGVIVNVSGMAGRTGFPYNSAYVAASHAVAGFTAALRTELIDTGVKAIVVCPGSIATQFGSSTLGGAFSRLVNKGLKYAEEYAREHGLEVPSGHSVILRPEDAAEQIVQAVKDPKSDVYTHPGSVEMAKEAQFNRLKYEEKNRAVFIGMKRAYEKFKRKGKTPVGV